MYNLNYLLELITGNFGLQALYLQGDNQVYSHIRHPFCECCPLKIYQQCKKSWRVGSAITQKLNEPYVYFCPQGLSFIIVTSLEEQHCLKHDCLVVGPVLVGNKESNYRHRLQVLQKQDSGWNDAISGLISHTEDSLFYIADLICLAYRAIIYSDLINDNLGSLKAEQSLLAETDVPYSLVDAICELSDMLLGDPEANRQEVFEIARKIMDTTRLEECSNLKRIKAKCAKIAIYLYSICKEKRGELWEVPERKILEEINGFAAADSFQEIGEQFLSVVDLFSHGQSRGMAQSDPHLIQQMQDIVLSNYMKPLSLGEICRQLHVSYTYMSSLINKTMGKGFNQYLKEVRVQASQKLLQNSQLSIAEVAYQVGFSDQSHFSKSFRSVSGISPQQFRREMQGGAQR